MAGASTVGGQTRVVDPIQKLDANVNHPAILFDGTLIKSLFGNVEILPNMTAWNLKVGFDIKQLESNDSKRLIDSIGTVATGDGQSMEVGLCGLQFDAMPISDGGETTLVLLVYKQSSEVFKFSSNTNDAIRYLELILKDSQGFIVLLDVDSNIRFVNQCFASEFLISPNEAIGRHLSDFVGKKRYEEISQHKIKLALDGEPQHFRAEMMLPSGKKRSLQVKLCPDVGPDGTVAGVLATAENISDLVNARNELEHLYSNFVFSVKHSGVGIIELDDSLPDWTNTNHIEVLLGLPAGCLKSSRREVCRRIHPDDLEINESTNKERASGKNTKFEMRLLDANNEYRWFAFAFSINPNSDGSKFSTRWVGTITDIDDLKNSQIDSADQVIRRDDFLAMLSHELRNPLMAIRYSVDLLTDFQKAKTDSREFVKIIGRQTTQLSRILDDLLDVSQFTKDKVTFKQKTHDLNDSVREVVETVRASFVEKQQRIFLDLSAGQLLIDGDVNRIKQAMSNMLQNASKYTPTGGSISISSHRAGSEACFCVSDSGKGILPGDVNRIFELFYRIENTQDRAASGMGVGLFLVKHVIEKHGGCVFVESDGIGNGSTFRFSLPLSKSSCIPNEVADESFFDSKTVCIVEDIPDSRIALKILLEHRGFDVHEFADAESALVGIPEIRPDVAIVDIGLPGKNGIELAEELRNQHLMKDVFLIALTGYGQQADCDMIDQAGFNRHIVKPAGIRDVCLVISEHFEKQSRRN